MGQARVEPTPGGFRRTAWLVAGAFLLAACAETTLASETPSTERLEPVIVTTPTTTTTTTSTTSTSTTTSTTTTTTTTTIPPTPTTTVPPVPAADPPIVAVGTSSGGDTRLAQERLLELGFWLQDADGSYGLTTSQAVMAFQKFYALPADGVLGPQTAELMTSITERPVPKSDAGTLVEVDKSRQVLMLVSDGRVEWIFNASTGTEVPYREPNRNRPGEWDEGDSVTRTGLHRTYREVADGWRDGDLGRLYRPKYFSGGIAVHGSNHVPNYPASHGCVRVTVPAMDFIWHEALMPMNTPVWVYGEIPR